MTLRPATPIDYPLFARFFAALEVPDPTPSVERWAALCKDAFFLEDDGVTRGYALAYAQGDDAHVAHVVVDPAARGQGVGRALMVAVATRLTAAGCRRWALHVKEENAPALALYRRVGMRPVYRSHAIALAWPAITQLASQPGARDTAVRALDPAEDGEVERRHGLPQGRIARLRQVAQRVFLRAGRGDDLDGVMGYDPVNRNTPLLFVAGASIAGALAAAIPAELRGEDVRFLVEDDDPLAAALREVGGETLMRLVRLEGDLAAVTGESRPPVTARTPRTS